jgi:nitrate reductase molybdenum cofactor assembly chaperone NarJ/NarW
VRAPRRPRRAHQDADAPLRHRMAALLLRYPDADTPALLADVAAALPALGHRPHRELLAEAVGRLRALSPGEAARRYVETFDHTRRRSLHLTYYRHGDTRARGMALLTLKHAYRRAGYVPPERELPDFLPVVLEFASLAPEPGHRVLLQCRAGLELLRRALHERGGPYGGVLDAVCDGLPALRQGELTALNRLFAEGPPKEEVGLQPFAPPEYLAAPAHLTGEIG